MKGTEESVARCDAAWSPVCDAVEYSLPAYDTRAVHYGFRRAWEIRDAEAALAQQAQPLTDEEMELKAERTFVDPNDCRIAAEALRLAASGHATKLRESVIYAADATNAQESEAISATSGTPGTDPTCRSRAYHFRPPNWTDEKLPCGCIQPRQDEVATPISSGVVTSPPICSFCGKQMILFWSGPIPGCYQGITSWGCPDESHRKNQ